MARYFIKHKTGSIFLKKILLKQNKSYSRSLDLIVHVNEGLSE